MKKKPNARAEMPRNLIFPRAELVYLPVTPEVARAVENAVQMSLDAPLNAPNPRRSAAGRAIRCHRPVQMTNGVPLTKKTMSVTAESSETRETPETPLPSVAQPTIRIGT